MNPSLNKAASTLLSALLAACLMSFIAGPLTLFGVVLIGAETWRIALFCAGLLGVLIKAPTLISGHRTAELRLIPEVFFAAFLLIIFSDFPARNYVYFAKSFSWQSFLLISVACLAAGWRAAKMREVHPGLIVAGAVAIMTAAFLTAWGGRMIFSDDHPSFLYRLQLLCREFPFLPFYNPQWNAGFSARDFFATGALNIFLIFYPFLKLGLLDQPERYSFIVCALVTVILPLGVFAACRILRLGNIASITAALLAFAPSLDLFEWLFRYGTLGFVCSAALLPPVFALFYRLVLGEPRLGRNGFVALIVLSTLCFCWTLSFVVFIPFAIAALFNIRTVIAERRMKQIVVFVLVYLLLNGAWIATFLQESKVLSFLSKTHLPASHASAEPGERHLQFDKVQKKLRELETKIHPLTVLLLLPGLAAIPSRRLRWTLGMTILWLLVLSGAGDFLKPQLELRRMNLLATLLALPAIGMAVQQLFDRMRSGATKFSKGSAALARALLGGAVLCSPVNAVAAYSNRSDIHFRFATPKIFELAKLIHDQAGEGRVFFFGFILHELGQSSFNAQDGGHVAPLALWSGKDLIASHFFHARWSAVDPIPNIFLARGRTGIEEFLDMMNVSAVVAFRSEWMNYCQEDPRYKLVGTVDRFRLYQRGGFTPSPTQEGSAELVLSDLDRVTIRPRSEHILLRYRYFPGLRTDRPGVTISGKHVFDEELGGGQTASFELIELTVPPELIARGETISIGYWR